MCNFARQHIGLAASLAAVVTLLCFFLLRSLVEEAKLNAESRRYADDAMVAVASNWDKQALLDRGSEELLQAAHFQIDIDSQFLRWSMLGRMVCYHGVKGKAAVVFSLQTGTVITATYFGSAEFARGTASITVGLVRRAHKWQVASFQVTPIFERRPFSPPDSRVRRS
jgi:hypothetical protein